MKKYGTLQTARAAGFQEGRQSYERGYISRKTTITGETPVYISGRGELFYYLPAFNTTQYCIRQYLTK